jgi:hypothetical protein
MELISSKGRLSIFLRAGKAMHAENAKSKEMNVVGERRGLSSGRKRQGKLCYE